MSLFLNEASESIKNGKPVLYYNLKPVSKKEENPMKFIRPRPILEINTKDLSKFKEFHPETLYEYNVTKRIVCKVVRP